MDSNKFEILVKCILLIYREHQLPDTTTDNSDDLIKNIISRIKSKSRPIAGGMTNAIDDLMNLIIDMINNPDSYDKLGLLQSLEIILSDNKQIYMVLEKGILTDMEIPGLKRSIVSLRMYLNNYYKESHIGDLLRQASYKMNLGKIPEGMSTFVSELITNLEALSTVTKTKDPGIVDEIDLEDNQALDGVLTKIKTQTVGDGRYKSGWKELNEMLGGGFRPGETVLTSALQHNYKSGFVQSLFAQLCMYNKPILKDKNKKPLNLLVSFEDDSDIIVNFIYRYLYYAENDKLPDLKEVSSADISSYIKERLTMNGFYVKMIRVNPSEWTYKHLFNKMLEYEASGYEICVLMVDYLSKLPTTGCLTHGPIGTDVRDLLNRVRNFCSSRNILFITPHQSSTDAKQLLRNGISNMDLVKEIVNKGYYEGSRQLDQVVDLEIHQHIAKIGKKYYLTFQRGKRRYPEIIDDEKKYFMLPFPYKSPIPPNIDLEGKYIGFKYDDNIDIKLSDDFNI